MLRTKWWLVSITPAPLHTNMSKPEKHLKLPRFLIFVVADIAMKTSRENGDTSFQVPFRDGSTFQQSDGEATFDSTYGFEEFSGELDMIICGRHMYDLVMNLNKGNWPYPQKRLIILTTTPLTQAPKPPLSYFPAPSCAEAFSDDLDHLIEKLAKEGAKKRYFKQELAWVMGGPRLRGAFVNRKLIDRAEIIMVPKLMADGVVPVWTLDGVNSMDVDLRLIECRAFKNGVVGLSYEFL